MSEWAKQAHDVVHGDRAKDYGTPMQNHKLTSDLWSAYLHARGGEVNSVDVCVLNVLQKISRHATGGGRIKEDTFVDIIGYVLNVEMIRESTMSDSLNPVPMPPGLT